MTTRSARALLPRLLAASLYYSGLVPAVRWWRRRVGPRLVILVYHRSSDEPLRRQLRYLRRHYRVLPLEQALQDLYRGPRREATTRDTRTPLAITFDDGYLDSYLSAAAQARDLRVPITIFLVPGYIDGRENFWWYETARLAREARSDEATIAGRTYLLSGPGQRRELARALYDVARGCRSVAEREVFLARARETLHVAQDAGGDDPGGRPVTWAQVGEMQESGWTSFGAHTLHHPVLKCLADSAELEREVRDSRCVLERRLGEPVRCFAYPLGRAEHIGADGVRAVQEAGYDWAVTTLRGINSPRTNPHLLRRIGVGGEQDWLVLAAELAGVWPMAGLRWLRLAARRVVPRSLKEKAQASAGARRPLSIEPVSRGR
ncbi:polysaccharide deacetylase family protein [Candidatus Nephthysia bennettiae]|uniref:Polysaccharide deacetylase family protein n=1 Tax=Candidatus Nephthysia bennettiae TaxID=3127016 RepID=A0A934KEC0_9BACT|nr:polysaccharide deacetylase family protein [Candidatus Dormibacteraeota bacterium]MBJ7613999.1 polysaccharide deacetylase family protein [Candidatus Dormibacteraeota bacterium]